MNDNNSIIQHYLGSRSLDQCMQDFDQQGFLVIDNVLSAEDIQRLRDALAPYLATDLTGRNDFEGVKTNRVYAMLAKSPVFAELAIHPLALALAENELGASCLLSACLAINLHPGETVQPWHSDDAHIFLPPPHPPFGLSVFWALDETTELNGATEVLPGSHLWAQHDIDGLLQASHFEQQSDCDTSVNPGAHPDAVKVSLKAGSMMIAKGALLHRGGSNRSDKPRLIITPQYCAGWARPLENMMAAVPAEIARTLPERAQELLGYSIHPPFMGYVDGMHPKRSL